jgi:cytochrome c oxidase subunit IV
MQKMNTHYTWHAHARHALINWISCQQLLFILSPHQFQLSHLADNFSTTNYIQWALIWIVVEFE